MHVVVALLFVAACGFTAPLPEQGTTAPDAAEQPPPVPTITPQAMIIQMISLECQKAFACRPEYPMTARPFESEWGTDLHDCLVTDKQYLARDAVAASVASGVIAWNQPAADQCFANPGIPASCAVVFSENWSWAEPCLTTLHGSVPDGGACTNDWDCAGRHSDCRSGTCM